MRTIEGIYEEVSGTLIWQYSNTISCDRTGLEIKFPIYFETENAALRMLATRLQDNNIKWLKPADAAMRSWIIDLDNLKSQFPIFLKSLSWLKGRIIISPTYICHENIEDQRKIKKNAGVKFLVTLADLSHAESITFPELAPYLDRFRLDHPDPNKCAFLAMKFEKTRLHDAIASAIREVCMQNGIEVLRADDKRYGSQLLLNVQTYMHGCNWGIAVFERLTDNDFNPNVSLEIGYMMAQGKSICLLKDSTLPNLHSDLMGYLYDEFDSHNPHTSIPPVLEKWIKNFSSRRAA